MLSYEMWVFQLSIDATNLTIDVLSKLKALIRSTHVKRNTTCIDNSKHRAWLSSAQLVLQLQQIRICLRALRDIITVAIKLAQQLLPTWIAVAFNTYSSGSAELGTASLANGSQYNWVLLRASTHRFISVQRPCCPPSKLVEMIRWGRMYCDRIIEYSTTTRRGRVCTHCFILLGPFVGLGITRSAQGTPVFLK